MGTAMMQMPEMVSSQSAPSVGPSRAPATRSMTTITIRTATSAKPAHMVEAREGRMPR